MLFAFFWPARGAATQLARGACVYSDVEAMRRLCLALAVSVAVLAVAVAQAAVLAAPKPLRLKERCVLRSDHARVVRFQSSDRTRLLGVELGSGRNGIVLAHQADGDLCQWMPFARVLRTSGYRVLAFDFRDYGSSQRFGRKTPGPRFRLLHRDVLAAASTLRAHGAQRIVLIGASMGGTASLAAAPNSSQPVSAVVALSAPRSFLGMDAEAAVRTLVSPLFVAAAKGDGPYAEDASAIYQAAAAPKKQVEILDAGGHGVRLLSGAAGRRLRPLILAFVADATR